MHAVNNSNSACLLRQNRLSKRLPKRHYRVHWVLQASRQARKVRASAVQRRACCLVLAQAWQAQPAYPQGSPRGWYHNTK